MMQGPECGIPVPSCLPCYEGRSRRGSPAAAGHRGSRDVLVKHPPRSLTPQTCVSCFLWEQSRFLPPHLGSDPDGNSSRPPKRLGVRLGGRRRRGGQRQGEPAITKQRSPSLPLLSGAPAPCSSRQLCLSLGRQRPAPAPLTGVPFASLASF